MANEYSASVTPFRTMVCGLPISTFTASLISLILYILSIILIFATKCTMNARVTYFLAFLIVAALATCCMAAVNMMYTRYHFNCLALSVSLLYSGSIALVTLGLIVTIFNGLCSVPERTEILAINGVLLPAPAAQTAPSSDKTLTDYRDLFQRTSDGETKSLFKSGHVGSYFIWSFAAIGDAFQIVAHYYYG